MEIRQVMNIREDRETTLRFNTVSDPRSVRANSHLAVERSCPIGTP
ncbi:hypothetical protein HYFRA_00000954 [Hymenoscyphus fraxineus]|uniref:Uncharacterized protein n=1 Tax=Hymenoscyphus fraxineus TaxID=746836 RepID=A0A9N9KQT4_9HELO|nr:hypothetical protein HYFRA_00000954 [Hymenoscyphus fraxineus]